MARSSHPALTHRCVLEPRDQDLRQRPHVHRRLHLLHNSGGGPARSSELARGNARCSRLPQEAQRDLRLPAGRG